MKTEKQVRKVGYLVIFDVFFLLLFIQLNIAGCHSSESPHQSSSNEYQQHVLLRNIYTYASMSSNALFICFSFASISSSTSLVASSKDNHRKG